MKQFYTFLILFLFSQQLFAQTFDPNRMRYIEQFKYWAMDEQIRTGVPAAISLAQGILETGAGSSELCTEANNHFGIKCKKEWEGDTYLHDDDKRSECFRKYKSAKDSYVDHSNFLRDRSHYASLFTLDVTDYKEWCIGLRKAGYATNPQYAVRLIDLIEEYNLQQYTHEAIEIAKENNLAAEVMPKADIEDKVAAKPQPSIAKIKQVDKESAAREKRKVVYDKLMVKNGRSGFWARKGDYLLPEAVQYNIRYAKLLDLNDLADEPLKEDMFIYLKRKAKKGDRMYHRVEEGETMHSISQNTGVILKYLYEYNNLYEGEEPADGEKIYLQSRSAQTPKLASRTATAKKETIVSKPKMVDSRKVAPPKAKVEEVAVIKEKESVEKVIVKKEVEKVEIKEKMEVPPVDVVTRKNEEKVIEKERIAEVKKEEPVIANEQEELEKERRIEPLEKPAGTVTRVVGVKGDTPILDVDKAKKVETLMGDGTKEIERLHYDTSVKSVPAETKVVIEEKAIPAPATNNKQLQEDKAAKNKAKLDAERTYDEKNVSDDVKDLKKKFDTLIYDDE